MAARRTRGRRDRTACSSRSAKTMSIGACGNARERTHHAQRRECKAAELATDKRQCVHAVRVPPAQFAVVVEHAATVLSACQLGADANRRIPARQLVLAAHERDNVRQKLVRKALEASAWPQSAVWRRGAHHRKAAEGSGRGADEMERSHDETRDTTTACTVRYKMSERFLCEDVENVGRRGALAWPSLQDCERPSSHRFVVNVSQ